MKNNTLSDASGGSWKGSDWRRAIDLAHSAPKCHARCKHTKAPCRNAAMRGKRVCRMHGGNAGAPAGERNGNYRNGRFTKAAKLERMQARVARWELRRLIASLGY